ncbi:MULTISPECIES: tyrosine-type recombinase/integrase [Streptomyces]|uniref:Site-specific integrase n=2 Tax=Streptomyces TaxID=1883 RepID=A0A3R7ITM1_9ACTN|nr:MULTISPECIES: site-specific integrase [Streptomyces]KNE83073.1 integrase [Streptomyces fradiae]OFA51515.1 integrase [Streptomyces fradiae]PQM19354.1 site-specific integrase [Streptomyces xinghaiensis]RKM95988.1 site-specific integrase [Streptomyces xinghaiensis]RNC69945.1 site-specific integrase [Streptomyces xinghaiensis]
MAQQRKRNPNGAGTITKRKDGRFQAAVYVLQPDGTRARKFAYGKTWAECDTKRRELLAKVESGVPVPTRSAKLAEWLPYWLDNVVKPRRKLSTYDKYEAHVRLYLVPSLGAKRLESLGVADVRRFLVRLEQQTTAATAKESHRVLRTALSAACREELITRNVASLVEPPRAKSRELSPWTLDETLAFLAAARKDPLYVAFVLAIAMGLRRGEIVGLRWTDLDLEKRVLYVRQQTQRRRGVLYDDDPKGRRRRAVPLPAMCVAPLRWHRMRQAAAKHRAGECWKDGGYVFATRTGSPVEPRNLYRSFTRVAESAGLRVIRLHDARHGCATLLTAAGVAPRVVMEILGHSQISITMDVYTHVVQDTQREAISHMDRLLRRRHGAG